MMSIPKRRRCALVHPCQAPELVRYLDCTQLGFAQSRMTIQVLMDPPDERPFFEPHERTFRA